MAIIKVKNLRKKFKSYKRGAGLASAVSSLVKRKYEEVKALQDISFEVEEGETLGIIGPNGAGKSTLTKVLAGVIKPDSGEVEAMGYEPFKEREEYVKNIGLVFGGKKSQLWWDLPAIDSFHLMKSLYGIKKEKFQERLEELSSLLEIKHIRNKPVRELSLGERKKCDLVAALLHDPRIVFLDEPTVGLDVVSKNNIRKFIKQMSEERGTTFLITSHDLGDIEELCKRILLMVDGKILFDGSLSRLKSRYIDIKRIEVELEKKVKKIRLPEGSRLTQSTKDLLNRTNEVSYFEIDVDKSQIKETVGFMLAEYPIKDISVKEPDIEEIVGDIYQDES